MQIHLDRIRKVKREVRETNNKEFRQTVGDELMKVPPHVAAYKSSVTDVKLFTKSEENQGRFIGQREIRAYLNLGE
jgi:hypothetical protein